MMVPTAVANSIWALPVRPVRRSRNCSSPSMTWSTTVGMATVACVCPAGMKIGGWLRACEVKSRMLAVAVTRVWETLISVVAGRSSLIVNTTGLPSMAALSAMVMAGSWRLEIVPVSVASAGVRAAPLGLESRSRKVSGASVRASSAVSTDMVWSVSPGMKVMVPVVAV